MGVERLLWIAYWEDNSIVAYVLGLCHYNTFVESISNRGLKKTTQLIADEGIYTTVVYVYS